MLIFNLKTDLDDSVLAFTHNWINKLSEHFEKIIVVSISSGRVNLPDNVDLYSMNKLKNKSRIKKVIYLIGLLRNLNWSEIEGVFFHMIPDVVPVVYPFIKLHHKKSLLWYAHSSVTLKLKIAEKLVDGIFTPSRESFRIESEKVKVVGHGIDFQYIEKFLRKKNYSVDTISIITVSRITPSKQIDKMINLISELKKRGRKVELKIIGEPYLKSDFPYLEKLKRECEIKNLNDCVHFLGKKNTDQVIDELLSSEIFLNFSLTGSVDKAVLEAILCKCLIITSNQAFNSMEKIGCSYIEDSKSIDEIVNLVLILSSMDKVKKELLSNKMINYIKENHSLNNLTVKIRSFFED